MLILIASQVVISYVPLCKIILKTEGGYLKCMGMANVDFIDSEPPDVQFSHRMSSKNYSLK